HRHDLPGPRDPVRDRCFRTRARQLGQHWGLIGPPRIDSYAVWSLVCAAIGLCCGLGIVLGPVAYLLGRWSQERIVTSGGALKGTGLARAGRVAGLVVTVTWALVLAYYVFQIGNGVLNAS